MNSLSETLVFCDKNKTNIRKKQNTITTKRLHKNKNKNKYKDFDLWNSGQAGQRPFQIE